MDKPEVPQKQPYIMTVKPGKYAWCRCGKSSTQPYCDGAHKGTSFTPVIEVIEEEKKIAWCGCKQSSKIPYCDGTHSKL